MLFEEFAKMQVQIQELINETSELKAEISAKQTEYLPLNIVSKEIGVGLRTLQCKISKKN